MQFIHSDHANPGHMYSQYFNVEIYLFFSIEGVNGYFLYSFIVND